MEGLKFNLLGVPPRGKLIVLFLGFLESYFQFL